MQATRSTSKQVAAPSSAPPQSGPCGLDKRIAIVALAVIGSIASFVLLPIGAAVYAVIGGIIPITCALLCMNSTPPKPSPPVNPTNIWYVFTDLECTMQSGEVLISFPSKWALEEFRMNHGDKFKSFATFHDIPDKGPSLEIKMREGLWKKGIESDRIIQTLEQIFTRDVIHRVTKRVVHIPLMEPIIKPFFGLAV